MRAGRESWYSAGFGNGRGAEGQCGRASSCFFFLIWAVGTPKGPPAPRSGRLLARPFAGGKNCSPGCRGGDLRGKLEEHLLGGGGRGGGWLPAPGAARRLHHIRLEHVC
jgi:hypothetical protein